MHACRTGSGAEADMHRRMSDDYGKNISALILSVVVRTLPSCSSCTTTQCTFALRLTLPLSHILDAGSALLDDDIADIDYTYTVTAGTHTVTRRHEVSHE